VMDRRMGVGDGVGVEVVMVLRDGVDGRWI
jgi:hypothetical protein